MIDADALRELDGLLDLPESERRAALTRLQGERPQLAATVAAWLAADRRDDPRVTSGHYAALLPALDDGPKPGETVGPYRLLRELGHGGMGSVWLAERTAADFRQQVALKLIRPDLASPEAEPRFRRERQILASLKHPNIAQLLDGGVTDEGRPWLAMEYVEGRSLRALLEQGALPPSRVLAIAVQLAAALAHAHASGVVHRDLKPENVLIAREGYAKILDFGIAKLLADDPEPRERHETEPGQVIGTLAYMSPEQAGGERIDFRSDQFSLGALIYELATGSAAFARATPSQTLAAVLRDAPPALDALAGRLPEPLLRIVRRCLEKDPNERYGSTRDLARDLADLERGQLPGVTGAVVSPRARTLRRAAAVALAVLALGAAWWLGRAARAPTVPRQLSAELPIAPAQRLNFGQFAMHAFALSPDGRRLVFAGFVDGQRMLLLRNLDAGEVQVLPGTETASNPVFSPDGEWLVFFGSKRLRKVPVRGGGAADLADAPNALGGIAWVDAGTIVYSPHPSSGLWRVSPRGGDAAELTQLDTAAGEASHGWPAGVPGSGLLLYVAEIESKDSFDAARIYAFDPRDGARTLLIDGGSDPRVVDGTLYYVRAGTIYAVALDVPGRSVRGSPQPVYRGIAYSPSIGAAQFAVAGDVTVSLPGAEGWDLHEPVIVDRAGNAEPLGLAPRMYERARVSPDGKRVLLQITAADDDVWLYDLERRTLARVTDHGENIHPSWMPDGDLLVHAHHLRAPPPPDLLLRRADGVGEATRVIDAPPPAPIGARLWPEVAPDARQVIYAEYHPGTDFDLMMVDVAARTATPWLQSANGEYAARFSPDGRWIAYMTVIGYDQHEVHLQANDGRSRRWQVSTQGGGYPFWSVDGRELYFNQQGAVYAVSIAEGDDPAPGAPRLLFRGDYDSQMDAFPDGQRFLLLRRVPEPGRAGPLRLEIGRRAAPTG